MYSVADGMYRLHYYDQHDMLGYKSYILITVLRKSVFIEKNDYINKDQIHVNVLDKTSSRVDP